MPAYTDALRGYAAAILARDGYRCRYCGLDGTVSFANWLALSEDHLLPKDHLNRNKTEFRVACCQFCNVAGNRYLEQALSTGVIFNDKTPDELVAMRLPTVLKTRASYRRYWDETVARTMPGADQSSIGP